MIITHHNKQFFKLQTGDTVIALNPISKESKIKTSGFGADIALITTNHPDYNGAETVTYGNKEPFVIDGPGEYEIDGIMIRGFVSAGLDERGILSKINTLYNFEFDGMNIWFLGALGTGELPIEARALMDNVDILFIPIGGKSVIDANSAQKITNIIGPKIIIPMDYGTDQSAGTLDEFLKLAKQTVKPIDKLTIKSRDISSKDREVIIIE